MKYLLDNIYEYDFQLIGISCHEKEYRICWGLNSRLNWRLEKNDTDLDVVVKRSNQSSRHTVYTYLEEDNENEYTLLSNRSSDGKIIPEKSQADYLLMIKENRSLLVEDYLQEIKAIPFVLTAFEIDVPNLRSKENLIF